MIWHPRGVVTQNHVDELQHVINNINIVKICVSSMCPNIFNRFLNVVIENNVTELHMVIKSTQNFGEHARIIFNCLTVSTMITTIKITYIGRYISITSSPCEFIHAVLGAIIGTPHIDTIILEKFPYELFKHSIRQLNMSNIKRLCLDCPVNPNRYLSKISQLLAKSNIIDLSIRTGYDQINYQDLIAIVYGKIQKLTISHNGINFDKFIDELIDNKTITYFDCSGSSYNDNNNWLDSICSIVSKNDTIETLYFMTELECSLIEKIMENNYTITECSLKSVDHIIRRNKHIKHNRRFLTTKSAKF